MNLPLEGSGLEDKSGANTGGSSATRWASTKVRTEMLIRGDGSEP